MLLLDDGAALPSAEHEIKLRRVSNGVQEMYFYVQSELIKLKAKFMEKDQEISNSLQSTFEMTTEHYRCIFHFPYKFSYAPSAGPAVLQSLYNAVCMCMFLTCEGIGPVCILYQEHQR